MLIREYKTQNLQRFSNFTNLRQEGKVILPELRGDLAKS